MFHEKRARKEGFSEWQLCFLDLFLNNCFCDVCQKYFVLFVYKSAQVSILKKLKFNILKFLLYQLIRVASFIEVMQETFNYHFIMLYWRQTFPFTEQSFVGDFSVDSRFHFGVVFSSIKHPNIPVVRLFLLLLEN